MRRSFVRPARLGTAVWALVAIVALTGCKKGLDEPEFVEAYVASYCQFWVDCADPVVVAFDGAPTVEECRAVEGPRLAAKADGCKLEDDAAELCLLDLDGLQCPEAGPPEEAVPASCDAGLVWKKCDAVAAGDDEDASEG
jgi:hypothetical protein